MYHDITGIILSGGKSTRMGENKSLLKIGDRTIIEKMADLMNSLFDKVIMITNDPDEYAFLNIPMYQDIYPHLGPLSGIHSGLVHSSTEHNFFISCDMPLMSAEMIKYLIDYPTQKPVTIAKAEGFIQQLCGQYSKACLEPAEHILKTRQDEEKRNPDQKKRGCKVLQLVREIDAEIIDAETLPFYNSDLYFNMNKQEDYQYVIDQLKAKWV